MPHPTAAVAVRHPQTSEFVALNPAIDYDADDIFVKTYPWAFAPREAKAPVKSVSVEATTAEPGQKRARTKPAK
jgi:hypothetical protein